MQVVGNAIILSASLKKGFMVGGESVGANLAGPGAPHPSRKDTPITGHLISFALLIHPEAYPDE